MTVTIKSVAAVSTANAVFQGYGRCLDIDLAGRLWVVYNVSLRGPLRVAHSEDGGDTWTIEDPSGSGLGCFNHELIVDTLGRIHVFWTERYMLPVPPYTSTYYYYHRMWADGEWHASHMWRESVQYGGPTVYNCCASPDGLAHYIIPIRGASGYDDLRHIVYDGDSLVTNEVVATEYSGWYFMTMAIVADSTGVLHIVFNASDFGNNDDLWYSYNSGGGWSTPERIYHGPYKDADRIVELAVDSAGRIHAVCADAAEWETDWVPQVLYAYKDGSGWSDWEVVATSPTAADDYVVGLSNWIARDGVPRVAWSCDGFGGAAGDTRVLYAERNAGVWSEPIVVADDAGVWNFGLSGAARYGFIGWVRSQPTKTLQVALIEAAAPRRSYAYFFG